MNFMFRLNNNRITKIYIDGIVVPEYDLRSKKYDELKIWDKFSNIRAWLDFNYCIWNNKYKTSCTVRYPIREYLKDLTIINNDNYGAINQYIEDNNLLYIRR